MDYNKVFNIKYVNFKSYEDFYKKYRGKVDFDLKDAWNWIEKNKDKSVIKENIVKNDIQINQDINFSKDNSNKKKKEKK